MTDRNITHLITSLFIKKHLTYKSYNWRKGTTIPVGHLSYLLIILPECAKKMETRLRIIQIQAEGSCWVRKINHIIVKNVIALLALWLRSWVENSGEVHFTHICCNILHCYHWSGLHYWITDECPHCIISNFCGYPCLCLTDYVNFSVAYKRLMFFIL